ncbi:MAG TPA: enoyl-CoA hydratase-related protein [Thermoleophilaceae bacterium]|nr:enoyl-CoA hydratase-related protein [Thermoleophilaceae bacterium]
MSRDRELASGKLLLDEPGAGVSRLRILNRERRGALDQEILDALAETVVSLDARCLVLTGSGPVFSAGYDLANLGEGELDKRAEQLVAHPFHAAIEAIEAFPFPVIAQLNGHAIGGGLELALSCDIRMAARGIRMGMPPAKLGLVYSHTGLRRFLDLCGPGYTAELFHVGSNVDAARALEIGLVNHVVEPGELEARTTLMAGAIAANAPLSLKGNKRVIRTLQAHAAGLPPDVERELVELRESCFRTGDFREGVRAFHEKRPPEWKGR